jgi:hypothetical protein
MGVEERQGGEAGMDFLFPLPHPNLREKPGVQAGEG